MKLPDFISFEPFNWLRSLVGAPLIESFSFGGLSVLTQSDLEEMVNGGKEISIEELTVLEDGTLAYKDSRVLLHIRDIRSNYRNNAGDGLPKFHVADCKTLNMMKNNNRFDRYVVSIRTDGLFDVIFVDQSNDIERRPLQVCWNCLDHISYKNFNRKIRAERINIRDDFSIDEYFSIYPRSLLASKPRYTSADAPIDDYPKNWGEISERHRASKDYVCENNDCRVPLRNQEHRRYLHVHHKNGLKYDCSAENLQSLCIYCHAEQPMHSHMKALQDYKDFLVIRRSVIASGQNKPSQKHQNHYGENDPFAAARKIALDNRLDVEDFRSKKGAFWVKHNNSGEVSTQLRKLGFNYHADRGWWKK